MAGPTKRANQIFISYRREDTADVTGRIYDRLVQKFGRDAIFKDVDSIPLGINFKQRLDSVVKQCDVVLVVIGNLWLEATDEAGKRRLDNLRDFVRIEIESALRRDIPVIPLFVQNAEMPEDERLPETLQELAYRNGMTIGRDPHFHSDVDRLIKNLENYFASLSAQAEPAQTAPPPEPISGPEQLPEPARRDTDSVTAPPIHVTPPPIVAHVPPAREEVQADTPAVEPVAPVVPAREVLPPVRHEWFMRLLLWLSALREARSPEPMQHGRFMRLLSWLAGQFMRLLFWLAAWHETYARRPVRREWFIRQGRRIRFLLLFLPAQELINYTAGVAVAGTSSDYAPQLFLIAALMGLVIGVVQAVLLRAHLPLARKWALVTTASALVGASAYLLGGGNGVLLATALYWLLISVSQWWLLRKLARPAWLWPAATVAVIIVTDALLYNTYEYRNFSEYTREFCVKAMSGIGAVLGVVQTACLLFFKRKIVNAAQG